MLNLVNGIINDMEYRDIYDASNPITINDVNENGFICLRNDELLDMYGIAIAGMLLLNFDGQYVPMIVTTTEFFELSENAQRFIIAHEVGHYNMHVNQILDPEYVRDIKHEFQADEFGAKAVGYQSAVFALEELQDKLDEMSCGLNKIGMDEVETRIENILNKANAVLA